MTLSMIRNIGANTAEENKPTIHHFRYFLEHISLLTLSMLRNLGADTPEENAPTLHHFRHF